MALRRFLVRPRAQLHLAVQVHRHQPRAQRVGQLRGLGFGRGSWIAACRREKRERRVRLEHDGEGVQVLGRGEDGREQAVDGVEEANLPPLS